MCVCVCVCVCKCIILSCVRSCCVLSALRVSFVIFVCISWWSCGRPHVAPHSRASFPLIHRPLPLGVSLSADVCLACSHTLGSLRCFALRAPSSSASSACLAHSSHPRGCLEFAASHRLPKHLPLPRRIPIIGTAVGATLSSSVHPLHVHQPTSTSRLRIQATTPRARDAAVCVRVCP